MSASVLAGISSANATEIVSYDFNNYANGQAQSTQANTGLTVYAYGDLPNFSKSGANSLHAVERSPGDFAIMLYNGNGDDSERNSITTNDNFSANTFGQKYLVSFLGAFGDYSNSSQITKPGDGLIFKIFNTTSSISYLYQPTSSDFTSDSFSYIGTGTGAVSLKITGGGAAGEFGGAVDNVSIAAVPEATSWAMMLVGMGLIGFAARRRQIIRVTYA